MQHTTDSYKESISSLDWIDAYNMYRLHQAWEDNLKLKNSQSCKSRKVKYFLRTKLHAAECTIQSFSGLIIETFMKTITASRWIIEDAWRWIKKL